MSISRTPRSPSAQLSSPLGQLPWDSFEEILKRLHQEGIYLHPDQLAEFLLMHGLPVDPRYVPPHLQDKAKQINTNYQGDMARLEETEDYSWYSGQFS